MVRQIVKFGQVPKKPQDEFIKTGSPQYDAWMAENYPEEVRKKKSRAPKKKFDVIKFKSWFRTAPNLPPHLKTWQKRKEWYQIDYVLEAIQLYEEGR